MEFTLAVAPPFSLPSVIRSHGWIQLAPFQYEKGENEFGYITKLSSGSVHEIRVREAPDGIKVHVPGEITPAEQAEMEQTLTWMLALELDLSEFYELASPEPKLAHVPGQAAGRLLRSATLFEDTVKTILTTNTAWSGTIRMVAALVENFGEPLAPDNSHCAFPTADQLAVLDEEALRSKVRLGYRAPYVLELARAIDNGDFDLEALKTSELPTLELRKELLAIKGIGDYAAANLLMLLGRYDYLPIDSWAFKMVSHEWYDGNPVGKREVEAAFEGWGDFKGLAYWFWNWDYKG
jgi:3-methyladenine DNA glycosylase/8-oxoguanine DNA glycosylase